MGWQEKDTNTIRSVIWSRNYDFYSNAIPAYQVNSYALPSSLYRDVKPSFMGDSITWPLGTNGVESLSLSNTFLNAAHYAFFNNGVWPGESDPSTNAPNTPSGLSGLAGNAQSTLSWNTSSYATVFFLKRDGTIITSTSALTYNDTGLNNGQAYAYSIAASNSYGISAYSGTVSVTPSAPVSNYTPARTGLGKSKAKRR